MSRFSETFRILKGHHDFQGSSSLLNRQTLGTGLHSLKILICELSGMKSKHGKVFVRELSIAKNGESIRRRTPPNKDSQT